MGDPFFNAHYAAFDIANKKVGFANLAVTKEQEKSFCPDDWLLDITNQGQPMPPATTNPPTQAPEPMVMTPEFPGVATNPQQGPNSNNSPWESSSTSTTSSSSNSGVVVVNANTIVLLGGLAVVFMGGLLMGWVLFRRRGHHYEQQRRFDEYAASELDLGVLELT